MSNGDTSNTHQEYLKGLNNEFLASTEYMNDLPNLSYNLRPFLYPYNLKKYGEYMTPLFAKHYINDESIGCDHVLGIDFLNLSKYEQQSNQELLDPEDMKLLIDSNDNLASKNRTYNHSKTISWLRKTEYISAENVRNTKMSDLVDKKLIQNAEHYQRCNDSYKSINSQIDAINKTFDDCKIDPILQAKKSKNIKPIEILPIVPMDDLPTSSKCAHVTFDNHPTFYGTNKLIDIDDIENAVLRGLSDQDGDYVGYYIPRKIPLPSSQSTIPESQELKYYQLLREYNWNIHSGGSYTFDDIYVFTENQNDHTFEYMAIPSRIKLVKRHYTNHRLGENSNNTPNCTLIVKVESQSDFVA